MNLFSLDALSSLNKGRAILPRDARGSGINLQMKSIVFLCSENVRIGWFDGSRTQHALWTAITAASHHLDGASGKIEQNVGWIVWGWVISGADEESLYPLPNF